MLQNLYKKAENFFLKRADERLLRITAAIKNARSGALSSSLTHNAETMQVKS